MEGEAADGAPGAQPAFPDVGCRSSGGSGCKGERGDLPPSPMHELALAESLVDLILERTEGSRVQVVRLEVGKMTMVVPEALRFCFEVASKGTPLEVADLEILEVEGRGKCRTCMGEVALAGAVAFCPCGSSDVEILGGNELLLKEVEVA